MSKDSSIVSPELRAVEAEIDAYHRTNPLFGKTFTEAAWYFLSFCEEIFVREIVQPHSTPLHDLAAVTDYVMTHAKWPLRWIRGSCAVGGRVPHRFNEELYQASWDLSELSRQYDSFESAFTYATAGIIRLELDGHTIRSTPDLRGDTRYDAYDRLVSPEILSGSDPSDYVDRIERTVQVRGDTFSYELNPSVVLDGIDVFRPELEWKFKLPTDWQFNCYTLGDFHKVASVLYVLSFIHFQARMIAAQRGCGGLGYSRALIVMDHTELVRRLSRYTGLPDSALESIVTDLTFGSKVQNPDPALQPLIPVEESKCCWAPNLILGSAMERNLLVLLNRFPEERGGYSRLSNEREHISRCRIQRELANANLRFWSGTLPESPQLPDVDLAIISDEHKWCLVAELKSFIGPADVREVIERSEEITRGIQQICKLRDEHQKYPQVLFQALQVSAQHDIVWAVISESSVGASYVQDPSVPVVRTQHLVRRLKTTNVAHICDWLTNREYLPRENVDYEVVDLEAEIAGWKLPWYGVRPLVEGEYL